MQRRRRADALARVEVPHRLHVAVADGLVVGKTQHAELDRIERIDPAGTPERPALRPSYAVRLFLEAHAHEWDEYEAIGQAIEPAELHLGFHRRNQMISGELIVGGTAKEKTLIALDVDRIGGAADIDLRLSIGSEPRAHGMADRAIDRHALDAGFRAREADWRIERRIASALPD